jgi:hypothetical protein
VLVVAEHVRKVLVQPAAVGHREQLHAPADAEHREIHPDRRPDERDLGAVAVGPAVGERAGLFAVEIGAQVGAAGEHQGVEPAQHVGVRVVGWQDHRPAAGSGDGLHVRVRQKRRRHLGPDPVSRWFYIGRYSDDRSHAGSPASLAVHTVLPRHFDVKPVQVRAG